MMKVSAENSAKIRNMSLICALLVVTIHIAWPCDVFSFTWLIHHSIKEGIARIAVPFFFVVSGFFLSQHMNEPNWYCVEVKKRFFSLVIPFVIWIVIGTILVTPLTIIADSIAHRPWGSSLGLSREGGWIELLGLDFQAGPRCLPALWYVRCLFIFVAFAPVFKWLVVNGKFIWLAFAFVLNLAHASWSPFSPYFQEFFTLGISLSGMFYFSIGIYVGLVKGKIHDLSFFVCFLIGLTLLVAKILFAYFMIDVHVSLITLSIPFILYSVWRIMPTERWPIALTSCSFPVFLLHMPLIAYFRLLVKYSFLRDTQWGVILVFVGVLSLSIAIAIVLRRCFPRTNMFLFVGRS